jgi:hypothetical protein
LISRSSIPSSSILRTTSRATRKQSNSTRQDLTQASLQAMSRQHATLPFPRTACCRAP